MENILKADRFPSGDMTERVSSPERRGFLRSAAVGALAAGLAPGLFMCAANNARRKPNVVILFIDDLGYGDPGCFGNTRIPTPHIDSLAARGVKCTMSYITNPPCSPSRSALMTGMYAQRFGKYGMARGLPIPDDHPTLAEFMRDAGYETGQIGKWDLGGKGQGPHQRGFTQVAMDPPRMPAPPRPHMNYNCKRDDGTVAYLTDVDGDYMAEFVERNREKPFMLYFSPFAVHTPVKQTPQHYRDRINGGDGNAYEGAVAAVDDAVGKLLAALKKHGLEDDTLIMLTGDNGPNLAVGGSSGPYRGGKFKGNTQLEGWVHTPTIITWPGKVPAGGTFDGNMCTLDFYATAASAAGVPLPDRCEGKNLLPFMTGEKAGDVHEYLFWHNADPTDLKHRHLSAVRWKQWRLVKYPEGWRLFNLKHDPRETKNLARKHPDVAENMRKRHEAFVATLPPVRPGADFDPKDAGKAPRGWGWATGDGKTVRSSR